MGLTPSMTCSDITTELDVADLTPNLSTALIKNFPEPVNGVTTEVAGRAILGTSTVVVLEYCSFSCVRSKSYLIKI
jgi:hypothetical protein